MKPLPATWKRVGEVLPSPARLRQPVPRTTTDGFAGDGRKPPAVYSAKAQFDHARHRWLGLVARDPKLPGAAHRVAVLIWQLQNDKRGCAWPSLDYLAVELSMHRSTVIRSLQKLQRRQWITKTRRGGRFRSNEYRIAFGTLDDDDAA